jgi:hypothetical protein
MKNNLLIKGARMLMLFLLLCVAGMKNVAQAQSAWEQTQNYLFYLVYADYQVGEHIMPQRENSQYDAIRRNLLPPKEKYVGSLEYGLWDDPNIPYPTSGLIGLAKNEKEGFQVFFREQEKERNLRIEVGPFVYGNDTLKHAVYYEEFFYLTPQPELNPPDSLAEALVPYHLIQVKKTSVGHNIVFYVELESMKNQVPGEYTSTITAYDGDEVIDTRTVIARVWNFALPDSHYSEVVMGLYNRNSGYGSTSSLFTLNGIPVDINGNVADENLDEAKRILNGYQNCLLEHGVSTYELPRWLMQDDTKAAELAMADPRRKVFEVPVHWGDINGLSFNASAQSVVNQYKDIVYDNVFLKDKAFFYPMDEPNWNSQEIVNMFDNVCTALSESWSDYHAVIPFNSEYDSTVQRFAGKIDILCPNQGFFDAVSISNTSEVENRLIDFRTRNHTWRYQCDPQCGGIFGFIPSIAPVGTMRRILFWQQYALNSDGFLNWNCAYLPNTWIKKTLPASEGIQTGNGDGILLYPSTMFGQDDAAKPVVSLRLKQLAAGIDDYDYLRLAKEFLGEGFANYYIGGVFWNYDNLPYIYMINRQLHPSLWEGYYAGNCKWMNNARYRIGEALSAANTEHDWGEWQIAVLPDEDHDGLEIRSCSHCGIQESRSMSYTSLYRFVGTEDNQWTNLNNWANSPETLPSTGESVVIDSDCEINDNTEVYYVVVNDGFNLTINEGATFTSHRITTEGDAQVIIEDGAQLYTMSEGVQAIVKKNITTQGDTDRWYFISTSLASDVVPSESNGLLSSAVDNFDLYWFNQSDNLEWRNYKSNSFSLENGLGYLYANNEENASLVFTGTTNGSISKEFGLDYNANVYLAGWNLVGNPYPCEVYANTSYYTLNDDGSAIEPNPVSSSVAIPACTGIMVKAETEGESVVFSKTAPETATNKGVLQIALNMSMSESVEISTGSTTLIDKVIVSFNQGDELNKLVFSKDNAKLYIPKGNEDYAIACVDKQGEIPLNFEAKENGNYTISVTPESVKMNYLHLVDNITGADIDLLVTPNYTFEANRTENPSRFRLVFSAN